jgi:hypothetical protein
MDATRLIAHLEAEGLTLGLAGGSLSVSPRSAITPEIREFIRAHRDGLIQTLVQRAHLTALIDRVAEFYRCTSDELATIKRIAYADPQTAWTTFSLTDTTGSLQ